MKPLLMTSFVPILISSGIASNPIQATTLYNDLKKGSADYKLSSSAIKHITESKEADYTSLLNQVKFNKHYQTWLKKITFCARVDKMVEDDDFQSIVNMGQDAVPFIINELSNKPSFLVWALNFIYNFKISADPTTTIEEASHKWIKYLTLQVNG